MRYKLMLAALLSLAASGPVTASIGASGHAINPRSADLVQAGFAALQQGRAAAAIDQFETALAIDPANAQAFIGLARAAQAQGLPGKSIKYYREALALDPNDLEALEGQGGALAERGATARAQINLARIQKLCGASACPPAQRLQVAIVKGPPVMAAAAPTPAPANPAAKN